MKDIPSHPFKQEGLKKYLAQTDTSQSVKYIVESGKERKFTEEFIKSNPLKEGVWIAQDIKISSNGFNINIVASGISYIGEELIKSKNLLLRF